MHRPNIYDRISQRREEQERLARERLQQEALKALPPPRFCTNELSFVRPAAFKDKTYHLLTLTDIGPSPFSLVIGRSQVSPDQDLELLSQQLLTELEKSLAHIQWIEPVSPVEVAGMEARRAELRWRQQGQPVHQLQLIFLHRDEHGCPLLIQITATSNNPKGMTAIERSAFEALIGSLELRGADVEQAAAE